MLSVFSHKWGYSFLVIPDTCYYYKSIMIKQAKRPGPKKRTELSPGEQHVVNSYISDPNGNKSEAYRKGFPERGARWQKKTINRKAVELFGQPRMKRAIKEAQQELKVAGMERRDKIIQELEDIAYTTLPEIIDYEAGTIRMTDFEHLTSRQKAAIKEVKIRTKRKIVDGERVPISEIQISLHDKLKALNCLSKIHGMLTSDNESADPAATRAARPEQILAGIIEHYATAEEEKVIKGLADRLTKEQAC